MASESKLIQNRKLLENFIVNREIQPKYRLPQNENPFGYIYCIENIKNGKKYIGSTYSVWVGVQRPRPFHSIHKRASMYLYEYNKYSELKSESAKKTYRPILQAMLDEGFENFIIYPVAETNKANHLYMENFFIDLYNTLYNGYNYYKPLDPNNHKIGSHLNAEGKRLRSQGIICINMNQQKIIFSESMKLFGDYLNSTKDMIKNNVRKGRPYKGWFMFYLDENKRENILKSNVLGDGLPKGARHSDKAKSFYQGLYNSVNDFLKSNNIEYFPGFELLPTLEYKDE